MPDESQFDPFLTQLCEGYTLKEVAEIEQYLVEWDASTYISVASEYLRPCFKKRI